MVRSSATSSSFFRARRAPTSPGQAANLSVPTAQLRGGDFSGLPVTIYDPATAIPTNGRQPFPGNVIPAARLNSITQKILAYVPLPNLPGPLTNFTNAGTQRLVRNNYDGKVNWNRTDAHSIWGKDSRMDARVQCDYALGMAGDRAAFRWRRNRQHGGDPRQLRPQLGPSSQQLVGPRAQLWPKLARLTTVSAVPTPSEHSPGPPAMPSA